MLMTYDMMISHSLRTMSQDCTCFWHFDIKLESYHIVAFYMTVNGMLTPSFCLTISQCFNHVDFKLLSFVYILGLSHSDGLTETHLVEYTIPIVW